MHDLYVPEIYRPGTTFLPEIVRMYHVHASTFYTPEKAIHDKVVRYGRSKSLANRKSVHGISS